MSEPRFRDPAARRAWPHPSRRAPHLRLLPAEVPRLRPASAGFTIRKIDGRIRFLRDRGQQPMRKQPHPRERALRARIAAFSLHARYDPRQTTAKARATFATSFERLADPDRKLPIAERLRRAEAARRAPLRPACAAQPLDSPITSPPRLTCASRTVGKSPRPCHSGWRDRLARFRSWTVWRARKDEVAVRAGVEPANAPRGGGGRRRPS
jgi:hypothetical protein